MKQLPFEAGQYYHIYNRGNNEGTIFQEEINYKYFIKLLNKYLTPILEIYSYCLFPNHFHLVVKFKDFNDLPKAIKGGKTKLHQAFKLI